MSSPGVPRPLYPPEKDAEILALVERGGTPYSTIATLTGVSPNYVSKIAIANGHRKRRTYARRRLS